MPFDGTNNAVNAETSLASAIQADDTAPFQTILADQSSFEGIDLPAVFILRSESDTGLKEAVRVSAFAADEATVTARGLFGTSAQLWPEGSIFRFENLGDFNTEIQDEVNALSPGLAGAKEAQYYNASEQFSNVQ